MRLEDITKEALNEAIKNSFSKREVIEKLGITYTYSIHRDLNLYIKMYKFDVSHFKYEKAGKIKNLTAERLQQLIDTHSSLLGIFKTLGVAPVSRNYTNLRKKIKEFGICYKHYAKIRGNSGNTNPQKLENALMFIVNSPARTDQIKRRIVKEKLKPYECSSCQIKDWLGKPLNLPLDHINGINTDNRLENLRFLCYNCHSQTVTFCGRNKKQRSVS